MSRFAYNVVALSLLAGTALGMMPVTLGAAEQPRLEDFASEKAPPSFATPEEAIDAFKAALAANDFDKAANLLGLDPAKAKAGEDAADTFAIIREGATKSLIVKSEGDTRTLIIGERLWPMPFPLVKKEDGKWAFDTFAGLDEIKARRIGENELETIQTIRDYVEAQNAYSETDHDGDGVLEYARKLLATPGTEDGLFWEQEQGDTSDDESPGGPGLSDAEWQKAKAGQGYFGYHYRILTGQGSNVAGGQYDYIINGNMIVGFGLVAWPVTYGTTGVNTFVVNERGTVYQADLGEKTEELASKMKRFNPDSKWEITDD